MSFRSQTKPAAMLKKGDLLQLPADCLLSQANHCFIGIKFLVIEVRGCYVLNGQVRVHLRGGGTIQFQRYEDVDVLVSDQ